MKFKRCNTSAPNPFDRVLPLHCLGKHHHSLKLFTEDLYQHPNQFTRNNSTNSAILQIAIIPCNN